VISDRSDFLELLYFFFQAEDGIRDFHVTGVQTCALPIFRASPMSWVGVSSKQTTGRFRLGLSAYRSSTSSIRATNSASTFGMHRSEERRVGKECRSLGSTDA